MIRRLFLILTVVAGSAAGLLLYAHAEARRPPRLLRATAAFTDWPPGAASVTAVLLSDIHLGNSTMDLGRLRGIVEGVNALHADLVLIGGDFIAGHDPHEAGRVANGLGAELARLRAPLGVVAVLGNHDLWTGQATVRDALGRAGVTVLQNDAVARGPLAIAGVADGYTHQADIPATWRRLRPLPGARLVLTHSPAVADALPAEATLVLAGHTHCGQILLPLIGSLAPSIGGPYLCGLYRQGRRTLVVTSGLGTSAAPFRLGAPPDEWLLTLGPAPAPSAH